MSTSLAVTKRLKAIPNGARPGERTGPEGKPIKNKFLLALSDRDFRAIRPGLDFVEFKHHEILHESHRKVDQVHFPHEGLISLVVVMSDGKTAEAGVVGNEGIVGIEGLLGFKRGPLREIVQVQGNGHRIASARFAMLLQKFPELLLRFSRFAIVNRMQVSQTAACNRLHEIDQRLARWLLMTQDRVDSGYVPLTQDFLATMLGTDRGSVTEAAGALQKRKVIRYSRGLIQVLNRKALEQCSCECYHLIRDYSGELAR
jgi:CRP-like cAMP-binding protein